MIGEDEEKVIIAEADFNLADYSQPNQLTDKIIVMPVEDPGLF